MAAPPVLKELWHGRAREMAFGDGVGGGEGERHGLWRLARRAAYGRTLELYLAEFGTPPPRRIWPPPEDLIRTVMAFWGMLGGIGLAGVGVWLDVAWVVGAGVGVVGLCGIWLAFRAPLGVTRPGD